ncbi:uncharacterized protein LOC118908289 [Manis pentadactyla]|uniref:uncharacterized protein LOC118908289 n=1 Tax=Manis pentadactyla TaxID=143292 RepID=UPI00255C5317|nr:uncharacterized protein LOC118908289 [Manis pentadactyla]
MWGGGQKVNVKKKTELKLMQQLLWRQAGRTGTQRPPEGSPGLDPGGGARPRAHPAQGAEELLWACPRPRVSRTLEMNAALPQRRPPRSSHLEPPRPGMFSWDSNSGPHDRNASTPRNPRLLNSTEASSGPSDEEGGATSQAKHPVLPEIKGQPSNEPRNAGAPLSRVTSPAAASGTGKVRTCSFNKHKLLPEKLENSFSWKT